MKKAQNGGNPWRAAAFVGAAGVNLAVCVLLGFFGGKWLGDKFDGTPLWGAVGALAGLAVGIASIIAFIMKFTEDQDG